MKPYEQLSLVDLIAEKIAILSVETAISIPELVGPNSMIQALADKKVKEMIAYPDGGVNEYPDFPPDGYYKDDEAREEMEKDIRDGKLDY